MLLAARDQPFVPTANKLTAKERALLRQRDRESNDIVDDKDNDKDNDDDDKTQQISLPFAFRRVPLGASMIRDWVCFYFFTVYLFSKSIRFKNCFFVFVSYMLAVR